MRLKHGDRLRCSNSECGLQVVVTDVGHGKETPALLTCTCGFPMKKFYERPLVNKVRLSRQEKVPAGLRGPKP